MDGKAIRPSAPSFSIVARRGGGCRGRHFGKAADAAARGLPRPPWRRGSRSRARPWPATRSRRASAGRSRPTRRWRSAGRCCPHPGEIEPAARLSLVVTAGKTPLHAVIAILPAPAGAADVGRLAGTVETAKPGRQRRSQARSPSPSIPLRIAAVRQRREHARQDGSPTHERARP